MVDHLTTINNRYWKV